LPLTRSALTISRLSYFDYLAEQKQRKPEEKQYVPVGEVFIRTLNTLSAGENTIWEGEEKEDLIKGWSEIKAWEGTVEGLAKLRAKYVSSHKLHCSAPPTYALYLHPTRSY